jgi:amino acid transporter
MQHRPGLVRAIGRWDLVGILINATVGAGILGLPGRAYALLGPWCILALLAGGILIALVGACYAEAGSRFLRTGGTYLYVYDAFGPAAGAVAGWTAIITRLLSFAAISNLAIGYAEGIWHPIGAGLPRLAALTVLTGGLTALVYRGVRLSSAANNAFTVCKLAVLLGFVAIGLPGLATHALPAWTPPPPANWAPCIVLLLFGLIGLEAATVNAGEMRDPRRDLPPALAIGVGTVIALYMLVFAVCMVAVPDLAQSKRPIFDGMVALLGPAGGTIFALGALATMTGTLFAIVFIGPRQFLALAENNQLPAALAAIHPRFRTPHRAVLLTGATCWALCVASTFLGALTATTFTRLLIYLATCAAVLVLRRRGTSETGRPLLLPGGVAIASAAAAGCLWVLLQASGSDVFSLILSLAPGAALAVLYRRRPS